MWLASSVLKRSLLQCHVKITWYIDNTELKMSTNRLMATDRAIIYTLQEYQE